MQKIIKITEYSINHRLMEYVLSTQINLFNYVPLLLLGQRDLPAFPPRCSSFTDQSHSLIPQLLLQVLVVHRIVWATAIHQHILFWFIRKILVRSSSTAHRHGCTSSLQYIHQIGRTLLQLGPHVLGKGISAMGQGSKINK